jgi:hypothetical protein
MMAEVKNGLKLNERFVWGLSAVCGPGLGEYLFMDRIEKAI